MELLRINLEPLLQKQLNSRIHGIVTRAKTQGTNSFVNWSTLMFTNAPLAKRPSPFHGKPLRAHELTQLSVNINSQELAAGLCIKKRSDIRRLRYALEKEANETLFDQITRTLAGREIAIWEKGEYWLPRKPRYYSEKELRIELLNPKLYWINAVFRKDLPMVPTRRIMNEILVVFNELFNVYALSLNLQLIKQPKPKSSPPKIEPTIFDKPEKHIDTDQDIIDMTQKMLAAMGHKKLPKKATSPSRDDSYRVARKALPLNASRKMLKGDDGKERSFYLDAYCSEKDFQNRIRLYDEFQGILARISESMGVQRDFIQVVLTNALTDAKRSNSDCVLANLMRYETNKSPFFWLFVISREIAYMREGRLSYSHLCILRDIMMTTLAKSGF